ncbi:hypothetical protein Cgig2_025045 [Carnegiea gigantea]|uniref:Uncharacterized protein n=1 Tax=Carnegiea gigantea TaxID=171969 RepID=A0A9Q1JEN6_9CARY|nr:hypothetical protein Cgig2_025045 [Carnegiea gigantea]
MELALFVVQIIFATLQCSQLRDMLSVCSNKSELESLDSTVETFQAVFPNVDVMQGQGFELTAKQEFIAAYKMSQELKNIRKKLDGIASDADKYSFQVDYQPIRQRKEETCSYVYEANIIRRDDGKKRIIDMLLGSNVQGDVVVFASMVWED